MGSNIDPEVNMRAAAVLLQKEWPEIRFSSVWQSKAMEVSDQPDFLNAVAAFESAQELYKIFDQLLAMEKRLKKDVQFRFGPRTIDLDLLLATLTPHPSPEGGGERQGITIPHPKLHARRFVLEPLIELVGKNFVHPVLKKPLKEFLEQVKEQECEKVKVKLP